MQKLDSKRGEAYRLRHWEMVQHLVWEVHSGTWPYADQHPGYGNVPAASWEQIMDHIRRDPRFVDRGLIWRQKPCHWEFEEWVGHKALAQFLGCALPAAMLVSDLDLLTRKAGQLRFWVHQEVCRARVKAGMGKDFPFTPNIFYTHMQPAQALSFDEPGWLEEDRSDQQDT